MGLKRFRNRARTAVLALLAAGCLTAVQPAGVYAASPAVIIQDSALEAVFRSTLKKPSGDLIQEDLEKTSSIYAYQGEHIRSLKGIEAAVNLRTLVLDGNPIEDFTPISQLTGLTMLTLNGTGIKDLSPLAGLTKLNKLLATGNGITDLTPLGNLKGLTDLLLENNAIESIDPLAGLPITWLTLSGNQIADITPLEQIPTLEHLYLAKNRISDLSPLLGLMRLKAVDLSGNPLNENAPAVIQTLRDRGVEVKGAPGELPSDAIKVFVDGEQVTFDQAPILENGTTLVPFRAIFEKLGLSVGWDASTRTVTGIKGKLSISLQIDNAAALVNGESSELDLAPRIVGGSTFVPLRFIGEATGRDVQWRGNIRTINIDSTLTSAVYDTLFSLSLKYEGETKDGLPHGTGKYLLNGVLWYEGGFTQGRMEGKGKMIIPFDQISYYEGEFKSNIPHGKGRMVYNDGSYYTGDFVKGKRQGTGQLYFADGRLHYDGNFANDKFSGPGTMWTEDGGKFTGSFKWGMMFGPFKQYKDDVLVYDGEFQGSFREGKGKEYQNGKLLYEGEYMYGYRNGSGKLYKDGKLLYEGGFINEMPGGSGIFYHTETGSKEYEGEVDRNERNGEGTIYYADGKRYTGAVYQGKANGQGALYGKDGEVLQEGFFFEDAYQTDPEKIKQTAEYRLFDLKKAIVRYVIDGLMTGEDSLSPQQALMSLTLEEQSHLDTYKALSEAERLAFINQYAQDHWGDVLGVNQCFVIVIYKGQVIEGTVTSYRQDPGKLKLIQSPKSIDDLKSSS